MRLSSFSQQLQENIKNSKLTIYDHIVPGDPDFWIPSKELEELLNHHLIGFSVEGLALRTRSKVVNQEICRILGYPVPKSFKRTQPRFLGQDFDVYNQQSRNLQIWNEKITPSRRYVIIKISEDHILEKVRVVTGDILADLDGTGKLTKKHQATFSHFNSDCQLLSDSDTNRLQQLTCTYNGLSNSSLPTDYPIANQIMPIEIIYSKLKSLIGEEIPFISAVQERNRSAILHAKVCEKLGFHSFKDDGRFPDVKNQLLEVKLQTSPTIDLGLFEPNEEGFLEIPQVQNIKIRMCDVRYVIFAGIMKNDSILIKNFSLVTGKDFYNHFPPFGRSGGSSFNEKLQILLPLNFFDD